MDSDFRADIDALRAIEAIPTILNVVCRVTGTGFAAVARVTESRWVCLAVNNEINFGLEPGGELKVDTTICHEVRQNRAATVIDHVAEDEVYCGHATPAMYGFQSYISMPIILKDGTFFGTLCAIDPKPAKLKNSGVVGMFKMFAELIAFHLDAGHQLANAEASLLDAHAVSELREQFIAVVRHYLRNPLASIAAGTRLLGKTPLDDKARTLLKEPGYTEEEVERGADRRCASLDRSVDVAGQDSPDSVPRSRNFAACGDEYLNGEVF